MKKLAAITVLGLVIGFSSSSFAADHMSLYTQSSTGQEVTSELHSGEIETSPMSFYVNPIINEIGSDLITKAYNDDIGLLVFGIRI